MFACGLDIGQSSDYTALSILHYREPPTLEEKEHFYPNPLTGGVVKVTERRPIPRLDQAPTWHLRHVERWRGKSYGDMVKQVKARVERLVEPYLLAVDFTGVGRAVAEMVRDADLAPVLVTIHGGDRATYSDGSWRVPKRDLVSVVQLGLQNRSLGIADGQQWTPLVVSELQNFRQKIDPATAHDSYSAWRENDHDDITLSIALALWASQNAARRVSSVPLPDSWQS